MRKKRKVLERYLKIREEKGLKEALIKLEEDKNLLPKSTYYWIRRRLIGEQHINPINLGELVIYEIDEKNKVITPEKVAEALDITIVMFQRALLEFLLNLAKEGEEKMAMDILNVLLNKKEAETPLELAVKSYEEGYIDGALGVLEVLNLIQYIPDSNKFQNESDVTTSERIKNT